MENCIRSKKTGHQVAALKHFGAQTGPVAHKRTSKVVETGRPERKQKKTNAILLKILFQPPIVFFFLGPSDMFWAQPGHLKRPVSPVVFQLGNYVVNSLRCGIYDPSAGSTCRRPRCHIYGIAMTAVSSSVFFSQCSLIKAKRLTTIAMVSR